MANETIELLKNYDPKKLQFPVCAQEKYDGVPARIFKGADGTMYALTRQGERINSIDHILAGAQEIIPVAGGSFVGELYIPGEPFKKISGLVRRDEPCTDLILMVFDADIWCTPYSPYILRMQEFVKLYRERSICCILVAPSWWCSSDTDITRVTEQFFKEKPDAEGMVFHSLSKLFQPGKRCWGTQRYKPCPTIDLRVVGFEEAISEEGTPLGMVGRINVSYKGEVIGVGPGKLTHAERKQLWQEWIDDACEWNRIAEIKYMKDDSYVALRQPTFQCWRPDKSEPDA